MQTFDVGQLTGASIYVTATVLTESGKRFCIFVALIYGLSFKINGPFALFCCDKKSCFTCKTQTRVSICLPQVEIWWRRS